MLARENIFEGIKLESYCFNSKKMLLKNQRSCSTFLVDREIQNENQREFLYSIKERLK